MTQPRIELIENAKVSIVPTLKTDSQTAQPLTLQINDYTHTLQPTAVQLAPTLEASLQGGTFCFIDGVLCDYRTRDFKAKLSDIDALAFALGVMDRGNANFITPLSPDHGNKKILGAVQDTHEFTVNGVKFIAEFALLWSPFSSSACTRVVLSEAGTGNAVMVMSDDMRFSVPVNDSFMAKAAVCVDRQIRRFNSAARVELTNAVNKRASVYDVQQLSKMLTKAPTQGNQIHTNLTAKVDPYKNLDKVYTEKALSNDSITKALPSHLTVFDAYRLAAEVLNNHALPSAVMKINRFANGLALQTKPRDPHYIFDVEPKLSSI